MVTTFCNETLGFFAPLCRDPKLTSEQAGMHERPSQSRSRWTVDSGEQQAKQGADRNLLDIAKLACGARDAQDGRRAEQNDRPHGRESQSAGITIGKGNLMSAVYTGLANGRARAVNSQTSADVCSPNRVIARVRGS
jgi:hypothetical protein